MAGCSSRCLGQENAKCVAKWVGEATQMWAGLEDRSGQRSSGAMSSSEDSSGRVLEVAGMAVTVAVT